jgi:hypothetical protein
MAAWHIPNYAEALAIYSSVGEEHQSKVMPMPTRVRKSLGILKALVDKLTALADEHVI